MSHASSSVAARRSKNLFVGLAVLAALVAGVFVPMTAAAAAPLTVAGTLANTNGVKLAGVTVSLIKVSTQATEATAVTSATGVYSFTGMPWGEYTLFFGKSLSTYPQYLGGETVAQYALTIPVDNTSPSITEINAQARLSGSIQGTITNASRAAVVGFTVRAYQIDAQGSWNVAATTTTNAAGTYYLRGLVPGAYRLEALDLAHAVPTYAPLYSGSTVSLAAGTNIGVVGGAIATYNFRVVNSGKISGVVTGLAAVKLAGVKVNVHQLIGTPGSFSASVSLASPSVTTSATGAYTISGLAPGYYTLEFVPTIPSDPLATTYGREFLGNIPQAVDATALKIANGAVLSGKNIQLTAGATLHGSVLVGEDLPSQNLINGIQVTVDHATADPAHPSKDAQTMLTDSSLGDNSFLFKGLGAGDWVLIIGSLTTGDTTRGRSVVPLSNGALVAGQDRVERPAVYLVDPSGMHPTSGNEPTIVGPVFVVGSVISANPGAWSSSVSSSDFTYQWNRSGRPIPGATSQSYQLVGGDWTNILSVTVSVCNFSVGCGSYTAAGTPPIDIGTNQADVPQASLAGTLQVGKTVTAFPGEWLVSGGTFSYDWQVSTNNTTWNYTGDSGQSHVITDTDLANGPYIRAHITGTRIGYTNYTADATGLSPIILGTFTQVTVPAVSSTATNFVVSKGAWSPTTLAVTALWTVHEADGSTTTSSGFTLARAGLAGKYVSVQVTATLPGYTSFVTAPKTVQVGTHPMPIESKLITGTAQVSSTFSAPVFTWAPAPTTLTWQWQYFNGTVWANIGGATANTYVVQSSMLNRYLRLITTEATAGYNTVTVVSPQTAKVIAGVALVNTTPASLNDVSPLTGDVVTVDPGVWTPSATISYQWKRLPAGTLTYSAITGATGASYTVPASILGSTLAVDVTATRPGHPTTLTTLVSGIVDKGFVTMVTKPTASYSATDGEYHLTQGTWSAAPDNSQTTYTWYGYDYDDLNPAVFSSGAQDHRDLSSGQLYLHVAFTATVTAPGYAPTTSPMILVKNGTIAPVSSPTLDDGMVGTVMTVGTSGYNFSGVSTAFSWQYLAGSTWTTIAGATGASFTPSAAYVNKQLRVKVTASRVDCNTLTLYTPTATVGLANSANPGTGGLAPTIGGALAIGSTLSALPGTWSVSGVTHSYQWWSGPSGGSVNPIVGATSATYKVPDAMLGYDIRVLITAKKPGYANGSTFVYASGPIGTGILTSTSAPVVTKSLTGVLSVSTGGWNAPPTGYVYEWKRFDPATDAATTLAGPSATAKTYKPVAGDGTSLITVTVSATRANYATGAIARVARGGPALSATTAPFVFGNNVVGSQLNAAAPDWSSPGVSLSYKWYRDGIQIPGASASSYTQVVADIAHVISVAVTGSKTGYVSKGYNLKSPKTLSAVPLTATTKPSITGIAKTDSVLTAKVGVWSVAALTYKYQWTRNGFVIPGATGTTYLVNADDVNNDIAVVVTASKTNYVSGVATSASLTSDFGDQLEASTPAIAPTATNGVLLKLTNAVTWNFKVTLTYQWMVNQAGGGWVYIPGANSSTFTPTGYLSGDQFRLVVTGFRAGHYQNSVTSNISTAP